MAFYVVRCSVVNLVVVVGIFASVFIVDPVSSSPLEEDRQALLQIKLSFQALRPAIASALSDWVNSSSTGGAVNNTNTSSAAAADNPCLWSRVSCSSVARSSRVTGLNLSSLDSGSNMSGDTTVTGFSNLSALLSLNLSNNKFAGAIFDDIANCTRLTTLILSHNSFSSLPTASRGLSALSRLQFLDLSDNNITGPLAQAIPFPCSPLRSLNLSRNSFTTLSSVPWQDCSSLQTVDLSHNPLVRSSDNSTQQLLLNLTILPSLHQLVLSDANLWGPIPASLCSSQQSSPLQHLDLSDNGFTGGFPLFLANCSSLKHLDISGNNLSGELSSEVGRSGFMALEVLNLSENKFQGSIPAGLGNLSALQVLMAGSNGFEGNIPSELSKCRNLSLLDFDTNHLGGALPDFLHRMPSLLYLVLHSNAFVGSIPSSLFNATGLKFLDLSNNRISGSVSPQFSRLSSLRFLLLADNQLTGEMPSELGELSALVFLDLSSNKLQGIIPSSLGNLRNLLWLMLAYNNLTGAIPPQLGNCTSLLWLNLRSNALTGGLPTALARMGQDPKTVFDLNAKSINPPKAFGECLMIRRWVPEDFPPYSFMYDNLDKSRCKTFWLEFITGIPVETFDCRGAEGSGGYIQVSDNALTGTIPTSLQGGRISMMLLSNNRFVDRLPERLGELSALRHLNVSRNLLSGPIPGSLGNSTCLALLDLSFNNLSGSLPSSLGNLSALSSFNVSYNPLLSGPVPTSGQLLTFGIESYVGDPLLCHDALPGMRGLNSSSNGTTALPWCSASSSNSSTQTSSAASRSSKFIVVTATILSSSLAVFCAGIGLYAVLRRRPILYGGRCRAHVFGYIEKLGSDSGSEVHFSSVQMFGNRDEQPLAPCGSVKMLTYADILLATDNFDEKNILGCGGFGTVFKAKLPDGTTVAIKKLMPHGVQGDREFMAEMETLGSIMQENLVPLLGCCVFGAEKLLVYKFLCNGSLDDWLHDEGERCCTEALTWARRLKIASDCAKALSYLHHECIPVLIHRDMKASNVLLDEEFNGYLADFGLAREMDEGFTHVSTVVAGTLGYVPPEYCQTWRATPKGDVYSFGVVMLELITGRHPISLPSLHEQFHFQTGDGCGSLVEWTRGLARASRAEEAYHPAVKQSAAGAARSHQLPRFMEIALACTVELPEQRPSMKTVSTRLQGLLSDEFV